MTHCTQARTGQVRAVPGEDPSPGVPLIGVGLLYDEIPLLVRATWH